MLIYFFSHSLIPQITHYFILIFPLHPWPPDNSSLGKIPSGVQDTVLLVVRYFLGHFFFIVSAPLYSLTERILQRSLLWPLLIDLHVSSQNEFMFLFLFTTWIKGIGTEEWHSVNSLSSKVQTHLSSLNPSCVLIPMDCSWLSWHTVCFSIPVPLIFFLYLFPYYRKYKLRRKVALYQG